MDDIKALRTVVIERAASLAHVRMKVLPWDDIKAGKYDIEYLLEAIYLDGVRDGMDYLGFLLDGEADV